MKVLTVFNEEYNESSVLAVSESVAKLQAKAAEIHAEARLDNEGVTEFLRWSNDGPDDDELVAYVDWNWGNDEVWRISEVEVL